MCIKTPNNQNELVRKSGLFDEDSYRSHYADVLCNQDPIEHYLKVGECLGFLPSEMFDPIAYKLAYPEISSTEVGPLIHFITKGQAEAKQQQQCVQVFFPDITPQYLHSKNVNNIILSEYDAITAARARGFAKKETSVFKNKYNTYRLIAPSSKSILDMIKRNVSFSIIRRPHGIWTVIRLLEDVIDELKHRQACNALNSEEIFSLAVRYCAEFFAGYPRREPIFCENFLREIIEDLTNPPASEAFYTAVSFKGYPTMDKRIFVFPGAHESDEFHSMLVQQFSKFFSPEDCIWDATIHKRGVISGSYRKIPELCKNRHVICVSPAWFADLGRRWKVKNYHYIEIPFTGTMRIRNLVLQKCIDVLSSIFPDMSKQPELQPPVFIFHCGASVAAWLICRLSRRFPDVVYFDMGQAIIAWFPEVREYDNYDWMGIYRDIIAENMKPNISKPVRLWKKLRDFKLIGGNISF